MFIGMYIVIETDEVPIILAKGSNSKSYCNHEYGMIE